MFNWLYNVITYEVCYRYIRLINLKDGEAKLIDQPSIFISVRGKTNDFDRNDYHLIVICNLIDQKKIGLYLDI